MSYLITLENTLENNIVEYLFNHYYEDNDIYLCETLYLMKLLIVKDNKTNKYGIKLVVPFSVNNERYSYLITQKNNILKTINEYSIENNANIYCCYILVYYAHDISFDWRFHAQELLLEDGCNNQNRVFPSNVAPIYYDKLRFRSKAEIYVYDALVERGLAFAPMCVLVQASAEKYSKIEPDFIIFYKGRYVVLEIDGQPWHRESPCEAELRLSPMIQNGAIIKRLNAAHFTDAIAAKILIEKAIGEIDEFLRCNC